MSSDATSLSSWSRAIHKALRRRGHDADALLRQAGLAPERLRDPQARYPLSGTTRLWELAVEATGDEAFGLEVAGHVDQTTFHALGFSLLASATLDDALQRLLRYFRIVTDAGSMDFGRVEYGPQAGDYRFALQPLPGPVQPADQALDAFMAIVHRLCRGLYGAEFRARRVCLARPAPPADCRPRYAQVFKREVEFAAPETALYLDAAQLRAPLATANPELARHNEDILARMLAQVDRSHILPRVRAHLLERLPQGEPGQQAVADALHMSLRNLQRRLADEGTTFRELLGTLRHELALRYIADPALSLNEISYLLGFADSSSFGRAFKRWTGRTPQDYREQPPSHGG